MEFYSCWLHPSFDLHRKPGVLHRKSLDKRRLREIGHFVAAVHHLKRQPDGTRLWLLLGWTLCNFVGFSGANLVYRVSCLHVFACDDVLSYHVLFSFATWHLSIPRLAFMIAGIQKLLFLPGSDTRLSEPLMCLSVVWVVQVHWYVMLGCRESVYWFIKETVRTSNNV